MDSSTKSSQIVIPLKLVSSVDLSRTVRELEALDDALNQAALREGGTAVSLPRTSRMLEDLAAENKLSLLDSENRQTLLQTLKDFTKDYPRIHISFTVEPSVVFIEKMTVWFRQNIHKNLLIDIGLQPTIVAGCVVRTENKVFDMSLRHNLAEKRDMLISRIGSQS